MKRTQKKRKPISNDEAMRARIITQINKDRIVLGPLIVPVSTAFVAPDPGLMASFVGYEKPRRGRPPGKSTKREKILDELVQQAVTGKPSDITIAAQFWPRLELKKRLARLSSFRYKHKKNLADLVAGSQRLASRKP